MPLFGEAKREYDRKWTAARRVAWFKDKKCVICGSVDELEIHHINPTTKVSHRIWNWAAVRRDLELAKCEVRCHACHVPESNQYCKEIFSTPLSEKKHGTNNTYNKHNCRCELCRAWRRSKFKRLGT